MRIVIPQKQLENLQRALLLSSPTDDEASLDINVLNLADKLCSDLYAKWESVDRSLIQQGALDKVPSQEFMSELDKLNDMNLWKQSRIDIVLNHRLFNILDEILEIISARLESENVTKEARRPDEIEQNLQKILKFIKVTLIYATNIQYFNSSERVTKLYSIFSARKSIFMIEELLGVLITISSKINEKKLLSPQSLLANKQGMDQFTESIVPVMEESQGMIRNFDFIADLLIAYKKEGSKLDLETLIDQRVQALYRTAKKQLSPDSQLQPDDLLDLTCIDNVRLNTIASKDKRFEILMLIQEKQTLIDTKYNPIVMIGPKEQKSATSLDLIEGVLILILRRINLYLNVGNLEVQKDKFRQSTQLEQLLRPTLFVQKLIQLLQTSSLSKRVHTQTMNILFLFVILDMNQMFNYLQPADNPYYQEACLHHELYNSMLQKVARYHAFDKIQTLYDNEETKMEIDQSNMTLFNPKEFLDYQKELVGGDSIAEGDYIVTETIKSQRFLNSFLNFLFHLLIFKNRTLQTQLYPQFLKPLLAIINVKPTQSRMYPINISCQLKAVKLLKEVVKMQTIDDPQAVERVIERLKEEICYLHDVDLKWTKMVDDDSESEILNLYRQDMIRTLLRFLSYTVIRNDPNAINFTQNFVANSRKILDSNLIQHDMMVYVFEANRTKPESFLTQIIDPIILQCIQLISYLFNDLPQKIPQFIENGVFPDLLKSLALRVPVQQDLISLLMKLIQTLCLNQQGVDLVVKSGVLQAFARVACDANAHKLFVNQNKVIVFSETIQAVLGQSKELAKSFLVALLSNYETLMVQTWEVTKLYADMENQILRDPQMSKINKEKIRVKYDKQQLRLEQTFEAASNLLFFYFGDDTGNISNNMRDAVVENADLVKSTIEKIVTTPLVASACSNMFPIFLESLITINHFLGAKYEEDFVDKIVECLQIQIKNLSLLLNNTPTFDDIDDVETSTVRVPGHLMTLSETTPTNSEHQAIIDELKPEDIASVVFAKIALYCEIVSKCTNTTKNKLLGPQNEEMSKLLWKVFKIQSMINRYHACIYEKEIVKDLTKLKELLPKYQEAINSTDFQKFTLFKQPSDDEELVKNLYFRYELEKIPSIMDKKARESFKTTIEVSLDENISHTSNMCQHAVRKLINGLLRSLNKQKSINFTNDIDPKILKFNQQIGQLIAEEFLDFKKVEHIMPSDAGCIKTMRYFCQTSAVFSEFNRVLFGSFSSGVLFIEFIERGGFECIKDIVRWLIRYLFEMEQDQQPKNLYQFKNFQLLFSHIIDFFVQLIEGRYLDQQYQNFLVAFKPNPAFGLISTSTILPKETLQKNEQELQATTQRLKDYFLSLSIEVIRFIFVELNNLKYINEVKKGVRFSVFDYFDQISEIFLVSMVDIYGFLCKGLKQNKSLTAAVNLGPALSQIVRPFSSDPNDLPIDRELMHSNLRQLVEMGFQENRARFALNMTQNSMTWASELLLSNSPDLDMPLPENSIWAEPPVVPAAPVETYLGIEDVSSLIDIEHEEKAKKQMKPEFHQDFKSLKYSRKELYKIIALSFKDYLNFNPITMGKLIKKSDVIDNVFFKMGSNPATEDAQDAQNMLFSIRNSLFDLITECHISKDFNNMGYLSICLTNLLSYKHGAMVTPQIVFQAAAEIMDLFRAAVASLKKEISYQDVSAGEVKPAEKWDKVKEKTINDIIKQIEYTIQLFMYITEEGKISSDLGKLTSIIGQKTTTLDQQISDIEQSLDLLQQKNKDNIFHQHKVETAEIFQKEILVIIDLFKAMHTMDPQVQLMCESGIHELMLRSLETLNFLINIKGFADFDCQSCFLQNEGLRALFGIRLMSKDSISISQTSTDTKRLTDIQIQSKILMQMLSQNEHTQMRVYENLIKSVLFIYFQEQYKQKEGVDIASEFTKEEKQGKQAIQSQTKIKPQNHQTLLSPDKKAQTKQQTDPKKQQSALISNQARQTLLKKAEHGEVLLDEFIQFFNSVMQIQDFRSFLQACQNVCLIVKKHKKDDKTTAASLKEIVEKVVGGPQSTDKPNIGGDRSTRAKKRREAKEAKIEEEKKGGEQEIAPAQEQYYVMMTQGSLRDMINQYESNFLQTPTFLTAAESERQLKGHIQQFQQEIVYTMLDQFIEQIRDQQMLVLQHCKQKVNPSPLGILSRQDPNTGHLIIKNAPDQGKASNSLSYQKYLFDFTQILSHLTFMATHSPILIRALLKHKEGKTLKFIIRNLYFLLTMQVSNVPNVSREYTVNFDGFLTQKKLIDVVNEFFKRVMFDNPHLTANERRAKLDARLIFQKEVLRNLTDHAGPHQNQAGIQKYPLWPQLRSIYNLGALWLLSIVFQQETQDTTKQVHSDKQIQNIIVQMQNYRNLYRTIMIKNLIKDCQTLQQQQLTKPSLSQQAQVSQEKLSLIHVLQLIQQDVVSNLRFFSNQKEPIQICIQTLLNILLPFESNTKLWGKTDDTLEEKKEETDKVMKEEKPFSDIKDDEEMNESEENDDESEESEDSEEDDDEDDEQLLDSELSERNFRFSQQDEEEDINSAEVDIDDEDEDEEYGEEESRHISNRLRQGAAGGAHRHHHHHHHRHMDEDEVGRDEESDGDDEEGEDEDIDLIENLLSRGPSRRELQLIEDDLDDDEDIEEDMIESSDSSDQSQALVRHLSQQAHNVPLAAVDAPANNEEVKDEEDDYDDEFEEDYDDEEGGEDEDMEDDDYYDEEIDDEDQEQVQIYVGRNPDQMDRLSLQDIRGGQQGANQVGGAFRRDDLMSVNNLSVDMLNYRRDQNNNALDNMDEGSADFSAADNDLNENESQQPARQDNNAQSQLPHNQDAFDDLIGYILGNQNSNNAVRPRGAVHVRRQDSTKPQIDSQPKDEIAYKPVQTMLDIVSLGKEMQRRQIIYKAFIKEALVDQANNAQPSEMMKSSVENKVPEVSEKVSSTAKSQFSTKSLFSQAKPPSNQQQIFGQLDIRSLSGLQPPQQQQQIQRQMQPDDIELDPEFMENLDQTGLQNIQQTENLMNFISNQSNQGHNNVYTTVQMIESISNNVERQNLYRNLPEHVFNQLPPHLFTEGLIYRSLDRNQSQRNFGAGLMSNLAASSTQANEMRVRGGSGWNQVRSRLHSMDQQLNDITDFSRQANDPYIRPNINDQINDPGNNQLFQSISQASRMIQNLIAERTNVEENSIYKHFNQYLVTHIDEMKKKPILDPKTGEDISQTCEQIIQQVLLKHIPEITDQNFTHISQLLDMIMIWIKLLTNGGLLFILQKESTLMEILLKIPHLRCGLELRITQWLFRGIEQLKEHDRKVRENESRQSLALESTQKQFMVAKGSGLTGKIDIQNFVLQCMRCFKYLSSDGGKKAGMQGLEMLKVPNEVTSLKNLIEILNSQQSTEITVEINTKETLLNQIIDRLVTLLTLISQKPAYILIGDTFDQEEYERSWAEILMSMSEFFKNLVATFKQAKLTHFVLGIDTVQKLCTLILSNDFKKKATQKHVRAILTQVAMLSGEGQQMIEKMFKESLNGSLQRFIGIIDQSKIDMEALKKEVVIINQILKFSKQNNAKNETNICDQDLFFKVVKVVSNLIDRKNMEHVTSSLQQAAFMFKEDFRTIMTTLFILFEYNLKFIFTEPSDTILIQQSRRRPQIQNRRRRNRAGDAQGAQNGGDIQVAMQDAEAIKQEIANEINTAIHSKDKDALIQAIDQHLVMKIKDEKMREDQKLKVFIRFCLEHKKIINSFIRANQQVLNESLRNVIMKVPQVLDFDNKRLLFRSQIKKIQKKYRLKYFDIQVRRDKVFDDSYEQLKHLAAERWKGQMNVEFADEQGIDEGGLTREWFILLSQEIFNPDLALFLQSNAGSTYYPNPKSIVQPEYLSLFKFIGRIVGKALYEQQLLDCYFVKALYKIILGMPLTYHDVEDFDNDVYRNLKWCLDNSVEHLGLAFTETRDYFGQNEEVEIMEGGKDIDVTNDNKYEYVQRMAYQKLYNSIKKQVDAFLQGFYDIVPKQLVQIFDNRELELLISGLPSIDIMDLKENTVYQNYTAETPVVKWLFEVLEEFENSERAEFIQFVTGSSKVPVEGFKGLRGSRGLQKFQIVKFFTNDTNRLPQAHTCFKQLELPEYKSKEQLKERMLTAIKEGKTFGFA